MKKSLIVLLVLAMISTTYAAPTHALKARPDSVYICVSTGAKKYHKYVCRGLARCTHEIKKVTVAQAKKWGYTPCKICY